METAKRESLFKQGVDEHMGIFLKTARGFTADSANRDDLVQEMLLATWQSLPSYNGRCKLSTFLYRVAHNRALNWKRSLTRYDRKLETFSVHAQIALDPNEPTSRRQLLDWLYATIRRLPPLDRSLIMLHLDRLPHRDIAEVTGLSEGNVAVRIHRIKQWLSTQKQGDADEP